MKIKNLRFRHVNRAMPNVRNEKKNYAVFFLFGSNNSSSVQQLTD